MPSPKHEFHFPRSTRLGAIFLLIVLLFAVFFWRILPSFTQPKTDKDEAALQQAWSSYEKKATKDVTQQKGSNYLDDDENDDVEKDVDPKPASLFPFNPNTASEVELLKLGLPKYTVKTILKYRAKSAITFKRKEDLQKLYTLSKADYERIAPYVRIPENNISDLHEKAPYPKFSNEKAAPQIIELNAATADELISLRGIGPGYSKRIINYRDALGGFFSIDQLKEVYGFPDSTYQQLKDKFTVNVTLVKQININIADEATLSKNPYIGRKLAFNIIKLRNDIKQFKEIDQLRQVPLINEEKYRKIAPYLSTH